MKYQAFKVKFMEKFQDYLPAVYTTWQIEVREVPKVNGFREAVTLCPANGSGASPTMYLDDLYGYYKKTGSFEQVCKTAASYYVQGIELVSKLQPKSFEELPKENIIFSLIPVKGNERLLSGVPHRITMDLAVIYRMLMDAPDGGFHSAMITEPLAEDLQLGETDLYELALKNTPRLLPSECKMSEDVFAIVSNDRQIFGATVMLYPGFLASLADTMDSDLFILPSSLHEVFVVPDIGQNVDEMNRVVAEANQCAGCPEECLSDHVYYYQRDSDKVCIPETSMEQSCRKDLYARS